MQYQEITLRGIEANQNVGGIVRGGYVYQGKFYYHAAANIGLCSVDAKNYTTPPYGNEEQYEQSLVREG